MTAVSNSIHAVAILTFSLGAAACATAPEDAPAVASTEDTFGVSQWSANVQIGGLGAQSPWLALAALNCVAPLNHSGNRDGGIWWATYTPGAVGSGRPGRDPDEHRDALTRSVQRLDPSTWSWRQDNRLSYPRVGSPTIAAFARTSTSSA